MHYPGRVIGGRFVPDHPQEYAKRLNRLEGQRIVLAMELEHEPVRQSQRGFLFGVILKQVSDWSGYEINELWAEMKHIFLTDPLNPKNVRSSKTLDAVEFDVLTQAIVKWFDQQGVPFDLDPLQRQRLNIDDKSPTRRVRKRDG